MRLLAAGGALDEAAARATLALARAQHVERVLLFGLAAADGLLAAAGRTARARADAYLDDAARFILDDTGVSTPPARAQGWEQQHVVLVVDPPPPPLARVPITAAALWVELLGTLVAIAVPDARRAADARESAHIVLHGGPEVIVETNSARTLLCPGDIAKGGALLMVDGPVDARVSLWSLDGAVLEARSLVLAQPRLTVQGGAP